MLNQETERLPILIGDEDLPHRKEQYDPGRFDLPSLPRCLWPSFDMSAKVAKIASQIDSPVWVEIGLGPCSPLHAVPARRVILIDTRPWTVALMSSSHDPRIWPTIARIAPQIDPMDLRGLSTMRAAAAPLKAPDQLAMAFILLALVGGRTLSFPTFDASLALGGMLGKPAVMRRTRHSLAFSMVAPDVSSAMRSAVRGTRISAKHVHIHINATLPIDEAVNMLLSLRNIGFSWSMAIHDPRLVHDVRRVADIVDWDGIPFAWCPRSG